MQTVRTFLFVLIAGTVGLLGSGTAFAGDSRIPSSGDVIKRYVKAIGGDKAKAVRETSLEGTVESDGKNVGRFTIDSQSPDRRRLELTTGTDTHIEVISNGTAWRRTTREGETTLVDDFGRELKAEALLLAEKRLDAKKLNFAVRSLPPLTIDGKTAYCLEFASRQRAKVRMYFDATTSLLVRLESGSEAAPRRFDFADYRPVDGVLEPFLIRFSERGNPPLLLKAATARHNANLTASTFQPPNVAATIDLNTLFADVEKNQLAVDERVTNYTYNLTETTKKVDKDGQVKETEIKVYEVYPLPGDERVRKLVSVNGKPLSPKDAQKEQERVAKFIEENQKRLEKKQSGKADENDNEKRRVTIISFLRATESYNPRKEMLRGREVIVCDFRPRQNFKPRNDSEKIANKLAGTYWIDATDRVVSRLEGRLDDGYKVGGGLIASLKKGAAFTFEQTRTEEGVWLPLLSDFNAGIKVFLIAGFDVSVENKYSEYKRFNVTTKIDTEAPPDKN